MSQAAWLVRFGALKVEYLHHIREEEQEIFAAVDKFLDKDDKAHIDRVFQQRKRQEKADAELTPRLKPAH